MDDGLGDSGTVQRDGDGGNGSDQGDTQDRCAERLRDMPLYPAGERLLCRCLLA